MDAGAQIRAMVVNGLLATHESFSRSPRLTRGVVDRRCVPGVYSNSIAEFNALT